MKLLLAVDNSEHSADAITEVANRPWPPKTIVRVISVVELVPPPAAELWYDALVEGQMTDEGGTKINFSPHYTPRFKRPLEKVGGRCVLTLASTVTACNLPLILQKAI